MDYNRFLEAEKQQQYITDMRPVFNKRALFSDMTEDYVSPCEPGAYDKVTIRIRSAKNNIDRVFFVCNETKQFMELCDTDELFDYYGIEVTLKNEKLLYYFEIQAGKITSFYDTRGSEKDADIFYAFKLIPDFKTPDWAKGAVMYQIFVERFCNGDKTNDVLSHEYEYLSEHVNKVEEWNKYPAVMGVREFYGGDLQGVLDKLDYLQDLGVDVIYFNPLFVSPSNHKYDIQDYDYIDPHFGKIVVDEGELLAPDQHENRLATRYINRVTNKDNLEASNEFFVEIVEEIHRRGMKVILDGVFNHCGSFNKWMDRERIYEQQLGYKKGAFVAADSAYHEFFQFAQQDKWPYNTTYDGWWGHDNLPKLNFEGSRQLYDYVLYIGRKWVSAPYNVDGWRLDVAADLGHSPEMNHQFWKDFRNTVKQANPEAIVLAEHYGDPSDWLQGDQWDTVMNYDAFMEPLTWFLTGMQKHSDDYREDLRGNADSFWTSMKRYGARFTTPSLQVSMNELSNHDHSRFLTRTNKKVGRVNTMSPEEANKGVNKAVMREAVMVQMTWPGAPTIYYGDEAGLCGFTDPDNRRTYPWGTEDKELISYHKEMIRIHKENPEFLKGSIRRLKSAYNIIAYGRFNRQEQSIVIVNNDSEAHMVELPVWSIGIGQEGILEQLMITTEEGFSTESKEFPIIYGKLMIQMPKTSAVVLKHRKPKELVIDKEELEIAQKKFLHFV